MFETVVPEALAPRRRSLLYKSLPVSIGFHFLVGAVVFVSTVWTVEFPGHSPKMIALYSLIEPPPLPPPPPPPPAAPKQASVVQPVKHVAVQMPEVAPTIIPEEIPVVAPEPQVEAPVVADVPTGVEGGVEGGVPGGVAGGELGGVFGGVMNAVVDKPQPPPNTVTIERDEPLPMETVSQEFPIYPGEAREKSLEDTLVVRYVIDQRGRVKNVTVIVPPQHQTFAKATLKAVKTWRFRPFKNELGQAKEVIHEMTVNFRLQRVSTR
jgi:periplasmic protein TonB